MAIDLSAFSFDRIAVDLRSEVDFVAHLPKNVVDRQKLFSALRQELKFPTFFGNNWDALYDCLRDLSWIRRHRVILIHKDLPPLPLEDIVNYLNILSECARDWKSGDSHELIVVFPPEALEDILMIVGR